jgi:hypothetical protein
VRSSPADGNHANRSGSSYQSKGITNVKFRNALIALATAATLMGSGAMSTSAQTATSSVTITSGTFSASLSATNFGNLPYSFSDQWARNGAIALNVTDLTGDAGGWQVTVTISDFIGQTRSAEVIPSENLNITDFTINPTDDSSQPVSTTNMTPVSAETSPQLVWTADPGYGQGSYVLNMSADLLVPGRTTAQTYTSTGTVTIVTGP